MTTRAQLSHPCCCSLMLHGTKSRLLTWDREQRASRLVNVLCAKSSACHSFCGRVQLNLQDNDISKWNRRRIGPLGNINRKRPRRKWNGCCSSIMQDFVAQSTTGQSVPHIGFFLLFPPLTVVPGGTVFGWGRTHHGAAAQDQLRKPN